MARIIVADDEALIRSLVMDFLKKEGHIPLAAENGREAIELLNENPDTGLVILDIMMPKLNGWETCRLIRARSDVPIIILTARTEEFDELSGFESGADDYIVKPFSPAVLMKRVEVVLKRAKARDGVSALFIPSKGIKIDMDAYVVYLDGEPVDLTIKEFEILRKLYEKPGRVFTREQLLSSIWGYDYNGDVRNVDSHVARLRSKLGDFGNSHLKTVYGLGYKLEVL